MNRQDAISYFKEQEPIFLSRAREKGYICPKCNNGMGADGDGITRKNGYYHCFKCGLHEDILGLLKEHTGVNDFNELLRIAANMYNVTIESDHNTAIKDDREKYTHFYKACNEELNKGNNAGLEYLLSRGISLEIANKFRVGYDESWHHPKDTYNHTSPRIIIPTSEYSYLARDIREYIPDQEKKYSKSKVGEVSIFNIKALSGNEPVFVVEGEIDALSVMQAGAKAIAIGSTAYINKFAEELSNRTITAPLIVALDNDPAGSDATTQLNEILKENNIKYYNFNISGPLKDANESLMIEPEEFTARVQAIRDNPDRYEYEQNSVTKYLTEFVNGIGKSADTPAISTGFVYLDDLLDGGLYEGLYILGAVSSLGKTTLIHQIADNIARNGNDVLYISLEMARTELMAKSISRHTYINVLDGFNNGDTRTAKTSRGITTGAKWEKYSPAEKNLISKAINDYEEYASRIYIYEGIGNIGAKHISNLAYKHYNLTGRKPVIFIDYLQILQPAEPRATDKQNTDKAVLDLKRLSRDLKIPVVAISSFNRENYKNGVSMQSFKESGAIEYGSDVLIGLQLAGAGTLTDEERAEMLSSDERQIELKLLKNRNGRLNGTPIKYSYYPMFNYYLEETNPKKAINKTKKTIIL